MIKSTIKTHITTSKHTENLVNERVAADSRRADSISDYYTVNPSEKGASVRKELTLERFVIARACFAAGCFSNLDRLRPVFERHGVALTHSSHMRTEIPKIQ
jgi:hypothetical protein